MGLMGFVRALSFIAASLCLALTATSQQSPIILTSTHVRVNALIGKDDASAVQCWQVEPPFGISQQAGTVGAKIQQLGNMQHATVVFFNETGPTAAGLHPAPAPQWVITLAGSGVVTLPTTGQKVSLPLGSIIIANDTAEVSKIGHNTDWAAGSIAVQLPFENGVVNHTVINDGICA